MELTTQFLDEMAFKTPADRTNAVALKLAVALRNMWPGAKPLGAILGNKSHCGKDTVADYAQGRTPGGEISWERADWAVQQEFEKVTRDQDVAIIRVGNVRSKRGQIASAFLERIITNRCPVITSSKTRDGRVVTNHFVVMVTANLGVLSPDLLNRSVIIRLEAVGDVRGRKSGIGNPREEFLPQHVEELEAETHGMICRWREAGGPLDDNVKHPMTSWARTVGGVLKVNGFPDFLGNQDEALTAQEDVRHGLGMLGAAKPDLWLPADEWVTAVRDLGLVKRIVDDLDRENDAAVARALCEVLSAHRDETLTATTESEMLTMTLEKKRKRWVRGAEPHARYQFLITAREALPLDEQEEEGTENVTVDTREVPIDEVTSTA